MYFIVKLTINIQKTLTKINYRAILTSTKTKALLGMLTGRIPKRLWQNIKEENSMENNKMIKLSRILETLFTLLFWILVAGIVLTVGAGLLILFRPEAVQTSLVLGPVSLTLAEGLYSQITHMELLFSLGFLLVILPLLLASLWTLKAIFRPVSMGQPFQKAGKLIRRLAWLELAGGCLELIFNYVSQLWIYQSYELEKLLLNDKIQSVSCNLDGNLNFLLFFAVLFLLSWVFDYGEGLQRLSDETL